MGLQRRADFHIIGGIVKRSNQFHSKCNEGEKYAVLPDREETPEIESVPVEPGCRSSLPSSLLNSGLKAGQ